MAANRAEAIRPRARYAGCPTSWPARQALGAPMKSTALIMVEIPEQAAAHHGMVRPPRKKAVKHPLLNPKRPPMQTTVTT